MTERSEDHRIEEEINRYSNGAIANAIVRCSCGYMASLTAPPSEEVARWFNETQKSHFAEVVGLSRPSETVLQEAQEIIYGQRVDDYGSPEESFGRIAAGWSFVLGIEVSPEQVALCMMQLKISRYLNGKQRDSVVDIAGYAGCLGRLHEGRGDW